MFVARRSIRASRLVLATLVGISLLAAAPGCTKPADAIRSKARSKPAPIPGELKSLPGSPMAVLYLKSPQTLMNGWLDGVAKRLEDGNAIRTWFENQVKSQKGASFLDGLQGTTVVGVYGDPQNDPDPDILVLVSGAKSETMSAWFESVLGPDHTETVQEGSLSLKECRVAGQSERWFHGEVAGFWALSNDIDLLPKVKSPTNGSGFSSPVMKNCWKSCAKAGSEVFLAVDVPDFPTDVQTTKMLTALGVQGVKGFAYSFNPGSDRSMDSVFVQTAGPHRGLLRMFNGKPVTASNMKIASADSLGFFFFDLNLRDIWTDVRDALPPAALSQVATMESGLGFELEKDVLGSLASGWSSHVFADSGSPAGMGSVLRIPMKDGERFEACVKKLTAGTPMPLNWQPGPDGCRILQLPMQVPGTGGAPVIAAAKDEWFIVSSMSALKGWFSLDKKTHPAAASLASKFAGRATWLGFTSADALKFDPNQLQDLGQLNPMNSGMAPDFLGSSDFLANVPWDKIESNAQKLIGDMAFAVVPERNGIHLHFESGCGVFPFLGAGMIAAVSEHQKARKMDQLRLIEGRVAEGQSQFRARHGRFATSLWELRQDSLIDRGLASGIQGDLLYMIESDGRQWQLKFRRDSDTEVFSVDSGDAPEVFGNQKGS